MRNLPFTLFRGQSVVACRGRRKQLAVLGAGVLLLWPSAAQAHGFAEAFISFVLAFFVLAFVATLIADYAVFKRWLVPDHPVAAAVQANFVTVLTTMAGIYVLDWISGAAQLESDYVDYDRAVREYSWPVGLLILLLVNILIKSLFLKLRFAVPYSRRVILALCVSNVSCVVFAGFVALIFARLR
jgi:hypothetical protein